MNLGIPFLRSLTLAVAAFGAAVATARGQAPAPATTELKDTIVTSDRLEMKNTGVESLLTFIGNVHLTGTNLEVTCDRVEILAEQVPDIRDPEKKATIGKIGNITRILATGNVVISQEGRKATSGRAEVLPGDDKIVLTEKPVVTDTESRLTVAGVRMTFFRGERAAEIEKPEVVGPPIENLGFPRDAAAPGDSNPPAEQTPPVSPTPTPSP